MILEVRIKNQAMYLFPSIEEARFQLMQQMFAWQAIVTSQQRLQSSRYQVGLDKPVIETYKHLLTKLPDGSSILANAYDAIERKIKEVSEIAHARIYILSTLKSIIKIDNFFFKVQNYSAEWFCYQALWDLQADNVYGKLGQDINLWMKCLNDIKKTRTTFDTSETRKEFGPVVVDYAKVQSKVSLKYDSWHKDTLAKFGALLGNEMNSFHAQVWGFS